MNRALFVDRDGTLNVERHYLNAPDQLVLVEGAADAIRAARAAGWLVVVITNQSGVARGYLTSATLTAIHEHLTTKLGAEGAAIDGIYACVHHPNDSCACRKPLPGLIDQASRDLAIDPTRSWMIGDNATDIAAGQAAGCRTVLVRTGHGARMTAAADVIADDLPAAITAILAGAA